MTNFGFILACIGTIMILGGITYLLYLLHPICALIFTGGILIMLGTVIDSNRI